MSKLITFFLFAMFPFFVNAQMDSVMITGKIQVIIDSVYYPMENAIIFNKQNGRGTLANNDGSYIMKQVIGTHTFRIDDFGTDSFDTTLVLTQDTILNITIVPDCELGRKTAIDDIKKNKAKLLLIGGEAPVIYSNQRKFERKYKIRYYDFGCLAPYRQCIISYNKTVFDYLDNIYGVKWRNEIRNDVIGIN